MVRKERRRYQRVMPPSPIRGMVGTVRVFVVNLSLTGVCVAHQDPLPAVGQDCALRFDGQTGPIALDCVIIRTVKHREAKRASERTVHHSGLDIAGATTESDRAVRDLIAHFVERALDEQKANARGIPATAALSFQTGRGTEFVRVEWISGRWRNTKTKDAQQPRSGFTVSASETEESIRMLCEAYEAGDAEGRRLIQVMAQLSISKTEGIPTRRYEP